MTRRASQDLTAEDRTVKRPRADSASVSNPAFRADLLSTAQQTTYADQFAASKPYLHCVMNDLVDDALLRKVREEIISELSFTEKETDIYKVHQTGDLANLDGLDKEELAKLSSLFSLRNALYSAEFRSFLANVTGCGPLSGKKMDMSINTYANGCHLINHDDVIGSRRVSFILYLPDPAEPWLPSYGGALELYPVGRKGTPAVAPTVSIPPQWNQFVMFTVQPGHSFHSVEEVVVDKARLSISGWFHVPQAGEEGHDQKKENAEQKDLDGEAAAQASLDQLQAGIDIEFQKYDEEASAVVGEPSVDELSKEDIAELAKWINPTYLAERNLEQVSAKFTEESSIQLVDFLHKDLASKFQAALTESDEACGLDTPAMPPHGTGESTAWKVAGPPHKLRYVALEPGVTSTSTEPSAALFADLTNNLFASPAFRRWLAHIAQVTPTSRRGLARRFRPGLDYTLAWSHTARLLDATLCLAPRVTPQAGKLWDSDEVGGYEAYMAPGDEEDAAVYKQMDDDGALLTVSAGWNVLTLVLRDDGLMRFIKYVSARAPASRWDVAYEYELPDEPEEDEDQEEEV
ncbi:hypothetical protein HKX48_005285 [Thoreauomyces humboldtii]|nr:hypothetical protein HKX48_005285 [Thoreauomyces humboldtii]